MGNKPMCCYDPDQHGTSSKLSLQPKVAGQASFAGCQVNLSRSLILNENSEAVVLIVNKKLKMGHALEEQLKQKGGQSVICQLKQVRLSEGGKLELGQVVYTHAGDLDFDYIFYAVMASCCDATNVYGSTEENEFLPTSSLKEGLRHQMDGLNIYTEKLNDSQQTHERQNIYECVINSLQLATTLGIKSIAFPVLEPFNGHISKSKIATIMLFAIKQFLKENPKTTLTEIKISSEDNKFINLFKFVIRSILVDNSETTLERSGVKNKFLKASSIYSSEYDQDEQIEQIKVDDLMKFIHPYQPPENGNKNKGSF